ncbi:MAG: ATP-binding cassette domain-containing protein [Treponema sp.]|nr:ATP-binding cassette domain-containing protein [Treponema sp.]
MRVLHAFFLSLTLGSALGLMQAHSLWFRKLLSFPLACIRATPVVALILIALFWFGSGAVPFFAAVVMALPVVITAVSEGFSQQDSKISAMSRAYGFTRMQKLRYIRLPAAIPFFRSAMQASFGMCWKVVVAGEVLSLPRAALGTRLYTAQIHLESQEVFALSLSVVVFSFICERAGAFCIRTVYGGVRRCMRNMLLKKCASLTAGGGPVPGCGGLADGGGASVAGGGIQLLHAGIEKGGRTLYRDFSLLIPASQRTAVLALSGAGKTSLLDYIAFGGGSSCVQGPVSYVFQEPALIPGCTILENAAIPLFTTMPRERAFSKAREALCAVGLENRLTACPSELSGGERQRAALARAFAFPSDVLLLDEPFQSQDARTKLSLMLLLNRLLAEKKRTVLFVTHDAHEAVCFCDRVLVLHGSPLAVCMDEMIPRTQMIESRFIHPDATLRALEERIVSSLVGR